MNIQTKYDIGDKVKTMGHDGPFFIHSIVIEQGHIWYTFKSNGFRTGAEEEDILLIAKGAEPCDFPTHGLLGEYRPKEFVYCPKCGKKFE